ncbi:TraE/TraK family type IV conjugative transfer system protein, partial [Escherichia coli]
MEHGARLSTSRVMAIAFIFMSVLIVLSLSVNVIQGVNNYRLQNEQRTAVTPMAFNAPFAVSQNCSGTLNLATGVEVICSPQHLTGEPMSKAFTAEFKV